MSNVTGTAGSLAALREAESSVVRALSTGSEAFRALGHADSSRGTAFHGRAEAFLENLYSAQALVRTRIEALEADRPYENGTMRRLIDSDLAVQRTAHVHRALVRCLALLGEDVDGGGAKQVQAGGGAGSVQVGAQQPAVSTQQASLAPSQTDRALDAMQT